MAKLRGSGIVNPTWVCMPKLLEERYGEFISDILKKGGTKPIKPLPGWEHGGPREPHIHIRGDIYLLDKVQWAELSAKVISANTEIFGKSRSISFEKMAQKLSEPGNLGRFK